MNSHFSIPTGCSARSLEAICQALDEEMKKNYIFIMNTSMDGDALEQAYRNVMRTTISLIGSNSTFTNDAEWSYSDLEKSFCDE